MSNKKIRKALTELIKTLETQANQIKKYKDEVKEYEFLTEVLIDSQIQLYQAVQTLALILKDRIS